MKEMTVLRLLDLYGYVNVNSKKEAEWAINNEVERRIQNKIKKYKLLHNL